MQNFEPAPEDEPLELLEDELEALPEPPEEPLDEELLEEELLDEELLDEELLPEELAMDSSSPPQALSSRS